jgi:hypothetical protein
MADCYQLFSEIIPALTPEERVWAEKLLDCTKDREPDESTEKILKEAGVPLNAVDLFEWPGFLWQITDPNRDLWLYGEEYGNVSHAGEFARAFLARFRPTSCWRLTWAETCSRPRVGEFGGGGLFVTAETIKVCSAMDWTLRQRRAFERKLQAHRT